MSSNLDSAAEQTATGTMPADAEYDNIGFMFTTIGRPECVRRLIESVRQRFPRMPIYVADQTEPSEEMIAFYNLRQVDYTFCPQDSGVGYCRSLLARRIKEPYVLFGDDDFVFTDDTRFDEAMQILAESPHIGIVAGSIYDRFRSNDGRDFRELRRFEKLIYHDRENRLLISIPIDYVEPRIGRVRNLVFYYCHMTLNWCLCRRELFNDERLLWDEQFKSNGEHENFFLQLKSYCPYDVVYYPGMQCDHHHLGTTSYETLRGREQGWHRFGAKWKVTQHLEIGVGLRQYSDYDHLESHSFNNCPNLGSAHQVPVKNESLVRIWPHGYAAASVSPSSVIERLTRDIADREHTLEERWAAIENMDGMIRERDKVIADQASTLDERWAAIENMDRMIRERNEAMAKMEGMIRDRDEAIVSQGRVLEERWAIIQNMERARIAELDGLRQSWSWRITAPLRRMSALARRLSGRGSPGAA